MKEENKVRTGFVMNSEAGTCTQKLFATRLSFPFSISDSFFYACSSVFSLFIGFIVTVNNALELSAVTKLEYLDLSGVHFSVDLLLATNSDAGREPNYIPKACVTGYFWGLIRLSAENLL